ncbi:MAG TPA: hypothetical protein VGM16_03060 [Gammaproteobacteria bacterium]|jgi:hypothetical protein
MIRNALAVTISALLLGACAGAPSDKFASEVGAAKDAGHPLVIYQLYTGRYNTVATGVSLNTGFINTSGREIDQVTLQVDAYSGGRPVTDHAGQVMSGGVTAQGNFVPDQSYAAESQPAWAMRGGPEASGYVDCLRLTAISVRFKDGSTQQAEGAQARDMLSPQLNGSCSEAPALRPGSSPGYGR